MEKNTQLPVEVLTEIRGHARAYGKQFTTASSEIDWYNGATAYATKLHQVEQENAELRRQNEKMKAMATGWRPLLEEALRRFSGISEAGGQPEDLNLINKIKKFLYGE